MTVINRLGSVTLLNSTLQDMSSVQAQLATLQTQISSGNKASTFQGLNGDVEQFSDLQARIGRTEQFGTSNTLALSSLQTADQAMNQMTDLGNSMANLIITRMNSASGTSIPFDQQMKDYLDAFTSLMNTNYNGRYIFSGTATQNKTVPDNTIENVATGIPDTIYYGGSSSDIVTRIDDTTQATFPVRGDDPAFQKIYAAVHQALISAKNNDLTGLKASLDLMQSGQTDLVGAQAQVNTSIVNLQDTNDRLNSLKLYWQGVSDTVSKTDIVAASTQVASYQAMLQATFQVYARLSQLRLSDYLK